MIAAAGRLARSPRGRAAIAVASVPAAALLALSPGGLSTAAALLRRRGRAEVAPQLSVLFREPLAGDAGLAVVEAAGRRLLVGYARGGVSLVADLGAPPDVRP